MLLSLYTFLHVSMDSLFGDEQEVSFWTVALFYLLRERNRLQDPRYKVVPLASAIFLARSTVAFIDFFLFSVVQVHSPSQSKQ